MIKIAIIAGARPNFIKIASIIDSINETNRQNKIIEFDLIHTGQHYDRNMSESFFEQLNIPKPNINLNCSKGSQLQQIASIIVKLEQFLQDDLPSLMLVVGDVNSTLAASVVSKKLNIKLAHVESGIRSGDLNMPEEINRIITDSITDYFFTTSKYANQNLKKQGITKDKIFFVGNTMIDTLLKNKPKFIKPAFWNDNKMEKKNYLVLTLHRPSNVDKLSKFKNILSDIIKYSKNLKIIFPIHPRTRKNFQKIDFQENRLIVVEPMTYLEFNFLVQNSKLVITDSGGITEEATVLGIPCMTLRDSTERPETVEIGTNVLLGNDSKKLEKYFNILFSNSWKKGQIPKFWDGNTGKRIVEKIIELF